MDKDQFELQQFLEQQLRWSREQAQILDEIDGKLHEMKRIVEYAVEHEHSVHEISNLNTQLNDLKDEVRGLEKQLHGSIH